MITLRVDDRLVHTQVVLSWVQALKLERIIVASDEVSTDPLRALTIELALPPGLPYRICKVDDAAAAVEPSARQMIVVASLACASRVLARLPGLSELNLANCARYPSRQQASQYSASVWLTDDDRGLLADLERQQVNIVSYPLPPTAAV